MPYFSVVINLLMFVIGFTPLGANPYVFLFLVLLSGAGQTFLVLEVWALVMDVIDYHELRSGRREEGTAYSCYSFARKLGQTLAGTGSTLVPAVILFIMFVLLTFCYKLSKKKLEEMHQELRGKAE